VAHLLFLLVQFILHTPVVLPQSAQVEEVVVSMGIELYLTYYYSTEAPVVVVRPPLPAAVEEPADVAVMVAVEAVEVPVPPAAPLAVVVQVEMA
jgi:hypothetical protein